MKGLTAKQQKWVNIIAAWSESGLTQVDYCRREQIDIKRFYLWKSKLKSLHAQPAAAGAFYPSLLKNACLATQFEYASVLPRLSIATIPIRRYC